ncbi:MAG: hypothetical protein HGA72_02080 [Chlorobiaceae bacterium]|nr:hypothetical protein [Chlorobiaceae bacterium]
MQNRSELKREKEGPLLYGLSLVLIVLGIKLVIVAGFGSSVPFWDQWDAEVDLLYRPFLEGSLRITDLFALHNEHRIFTSRVLGLGLFLINKGVFDPMLEMYVNAILHVGALTVLLFLMQKGLQGSMKLLLFAFATILFAVPFGRENTLAGFQSQFYFLMLFSFLLLWSAHRLESAPLKWIAVVVLAAFLSVFSMASGALSIAAAAGLLFVRWLAGIDRKAPSFLLFFALLVAFVLAVKSTPVISYHAGLRAQDPLEFTIAVVSATGGGILYLPIAIFMFRQLIRPPSADSHSWFIFSLGLWMFGQILAIAYGRGDGILASRYLDLFAVGILLNAYCLMLLINEGIRPVLARNCTVFWMLLVITGLGAFTPKIMRDIEEKKMVTIRNQENVNGYLMTGNVAFLQKDAYSEIPYPDSAKLKSLLDNPTIAGILTPAVNNHNTNRGLKLYTDKSRKKLMLAGSLLLFYGAGLLLLITFWQAGKEYEKEA